MYFWCMPFVFVDIYYVLILEVIPCFLVFYLRGFFSQIVRGLAFILNLLFNIFFPLLTGWKTLNLYGIKKLKSLRLLINLRE